MGGRGPAGLAMWLEEDPSPAEVVTIHRHAEG